MGLEPALVLGTFCEAHDNAGYFRLARWLKSCSDTKGAIMLERRRARRFPLCLRAVGQYFEPGEQLRELRGDTFDISRIGLYLLSDRVIRAGTSIDLELELPVAREEGDSVRVRCRARVVRTDPTGEAALPTPVVGLACVIEQIYSYAGLSDDLASVAATA